jgi:hypothetical protein
MKFLILLISMISFVEMSYAGKGSDGGGKAVVCRKKGKIIAGGVHIRDLFEAEDMYSLKPLKFKRSASVKDIVDAVKKKLEHSVEQPSIELFPDIDKVQELMHLVPPEALVNEVADDGNVATPRLKKGCKLEQMANYTRENDLFVDREMWRQADNKNKAAFILHEGIYKYERTYGATNSRRSRKVVAYAMSVFEFEDIHAEIPESAQLCQSDKDKFYLWPNAEQGAWVQYIVKSGTNVYSMTRALLPMSLPWPPAGVKCADPSSICGFTATAMVHSTFDNWELAGFGTKQIDGVVSLVSVEGGGAIQCSPRSPASQSRRLEK